jgi:hypothetical protein
VINVMAFIEEVKKEDLNKENLYCYEIIKQK